MFSGVELRRDLGLLNGAIDMHLHAGPSLFPRLMDSLEVAKSSRKAGLRGILVKNHHMPTVERAYFTMKAVRGIDFYGGVTLNYGVGGLNPFAVDATLKMGGKMVWMPSVDAKNHKKHFGELGRYGGKLGYEKPGFYTGAEGITVLDEDGNLFPEVGHIIDLIKDHNAALSTSHLSVLESMTLVEEARKQSIPVVVTHVSFVTANLSCEDQKRMANKGAFLELCYSSLSPAWRNITIDEVVKNVKSVGPENYILASDLGQVHNPEPSEGLRIYITLLLERGLETEDLRVMVKENPDRVLGID